MANLHLTNPKLGNANVSSLVKSAQAAQKTIQSMQDKAQADTYKYSLKSDSDYQAYASYLGGRINSLQASGSPSDAMSAMNLQDTLRTAQTGNLSSNVKRSTISVLDGQGTPDQKLAVLGNAFQQLYAIGDLSAAQSYEEQYYSYSQTVQYQKQQAADALAQASRDAASAGREASNAYSSAVSQAESTIKNNIQNANAAFAAQGPKFLDKQTNAYLKNNVDQTGAKVNGSASIFAALAGQVGMVNKGIQLNNNTKYQQGTYTPGSMLDIYTQAMIADPTHAAQYQTSIDAYLNGATGIALPGEGNKSITYNALMNTVYAGNSGNSPYSLVQGADGSWQVQAGHVTGYTFGKDMNGATKLMAAYSFFNQSIDSKPDLQKAVKAAGLNVKEDSNGDWYFQATNQGSFLGKLFGNYAVQGAIQKDGSVEFMGNNGQLYKMVKGSNGLLGVQQINEFGQIVNPNVAGQYGFKPPANQTLVTKGSTAFMTKVLGDTAAPNIQGNKVVYQANGKTYQLVTDLKGLKGLQEIDKTGKVINANVAGQYGFNPDSLSRSAPIYDGTHMSTSQFASSLTNGSLLTQNLRNQAGNPNFHAPGSLFGSTPQWLGVSQLINNGLVMQSINQMHDQAMIALQTQAAQAQARLALPVAPPAPQPQLRVAPPAPQPQLRVAASQPTAASVQQATPVHIQGSSPTLQGGNVNLQGGGGFNLQGGGGIRLQ